MVLIMACGCPMQPLRPLGPGVLPSHQPRPLNPNPNLGRVRPCLKAEAASGVPSSPYRRLGAPAWLPHQTAGPSRDGNQGLKSKNDALGPLAAARN